MKDIKKEWRKKAREYLAEAFGGKCTICGYNKCIAALDYHHVDSSTKDSLLSTAMRNGYAWSKIIVEARKCTIVCARCHREIHAGVTSLPNNYAKFNEDYVDIIRMKQAEFNSCPICGSQKKKAKHVCSPECRAEHQKRFTISKEELERLVVLYPYETIGTFFGVSGNSIRKRCKKFGIPLPSKRGYWAKKNAKNADVA